VATATGARTGRSTSSASASGPSAARDANSTCALSLQQRCPLHEEADFIFYDEESITPELEGQLRMLPPSAPIAYARSQRDADGREFPVTTMIFSRPTPRR
jgi:hypothetical protein